MWGTAPAGNDRGICVIYGNGSMARVVFSYLRRSRRVAGFAVDDCCIADGADTFCGLPLVPLSRLQERFSPAVCSVLPAVGFLEMNELRRRKQRELEAMGYTVGRYIHESVLEHDGVTVGAGSVILDHVAVHPGTRIGRGVFIAGNVNIGHDCTIGDFCWINAGVSLAGCVQVGDGTFFGVNSCVGNGVDIGARNFIGANTLIGKNTADDEVYVSPAGVKFPLGSREFLTYSRILEH